MGLGFGILLGVLSLVIGQWWGGGSPIGLLQPASFFMILVGTFAAVWVSFPRAEFKGAFSRLGSSLRDAPVDWATLAKEIALVASTARKDGFLALDALRGGLKTPGLAQGAKYLMDGFDGAQIRDLYDAQIQRTRDEGALPGRLWEAAGAYAPTLGVIAAALALIRALASLDDPAALGAGMAQAFVALIYGILLSTLVFLPFANRVRRNSEGAGLPLEMVKASVLSIQEGLNPHLIEEKLKQMAPPGAL